ncbi:30S ribosomal protein S15 [Candidatus Similichlamydia epinepheli]|uniref:30S ribosomal protein S15 n=1 Tax=Candidatus Similichlamydia epinepheli TaxID=1903953 RepID=UPI000D3C5746|nr:30S ribosomal protein S15 [Candidatus Similichlamydia epinepheli]
MSLDKRTKDEILKRFQLHEKDTGSADVQIAILSEKIAEMSEHCKKNTKDRSARLALLKLVAARRRLLEYLNSTDTKRYRSLISRLNLRR